MRDAGRRERVALQQLPHTLPGHARALRAAIKPLAPRTGDLPPKAREERRVSGNPVILEVTSELPREGLPLRADGVVPVLPAPGSDPLKGTAKAVLGCLAFDDPLAGAGLAPEVGEAQEVERSRAPCGPSIRRRRPPIWAAVFDQLSLLGMQFQPVPLESLREHGHHAARILLVRKQKHSVIRVADEVGFTR